MQDEQARTNVLGLLSYTAVGTQCSLTPSLLYHADLNAIEHILAKMKDYVTRHNLTFKMTDVKTNIEMQTDIQTVKSLF